MFRPGDLAGRNQPSRSLECLASLLRTGEAIIMHDNPIHTFFQVLAGNIPDQLSALSH